MKIKRNLLILSLVTAAFALSACSITVTRNPDADLTITRGSGTLTSETRQVSDFDAVQIDGFGKLIITQGETESLKIEAEDNILPHITSQVKGKTLYLGLDNNRWQSSFFPTESVTFYLTVKNLQSIDLSGAAEIQMDALHTDNMKLNVSGAGNVEIKALNAESLKVSYSGAGKCSLGGEVQKQDVRVSGLGNYSASDLRSQTASINLSGAGNMEIWAEDSLDINVSGAGNVEYWGTPRVSQDISGIGNIKSRGSQ